MSPPEDGTAGAPSPPRDRRPPSPAGAWSHPGEGAAPEGVGRPRDPTRPVVVEAPEPVPLRPMAISTIIDGGLEILKARPRQLLVAAAVPMVPVLALGCWLRGGPFRYDLAGMVVTVLEDGESFAGASGRDSGLLWLSVLVELLPAFLVGVMVGRAVLAWYAGSDPSARTVLRDGLRRPGATLVAFLGSSLLKGVGALALCIGAPVMATWVVPLAAVLGVEQRGGPASIRRSWQLVSRRYFPVLGTLLLVAVVDQLLRLGLTALPWMLAGSLPDAVGEVVRWGSTLGAGVVSAVFVAATATLVYLDLRIRTEGLDLELEVPTAFPVDA